MRVIELEKPATADTASTLRILLLEKSEADSQRILEELRRAGMAVETTVIAGRDEFLEAISSREYAVILSAYELPGWSGMEALQELRKAGKQAAFILVTGVLGEDAEVECLKQGVSDYVLKNRLARLPMALRRALEETQLREANNEARRALQESETRNRELIENSAYEVFRVSLDGTFSLGNPALLHILACSSLKVLQTLNLSTDVFRFPEQFVKLQTACRRDGLVQSAEAEWRRKDGGMVAVKLHLRYLPAAGGADEMEGFVEDVTELRSLERHLLQSQKFETIGQLAGGIAHDFNNVVGAILGWAELGYEQSRPHPAIAERFARIRDQADRAAALTRELLAFARRQQLQASPIDLNSVVQKLTAFLEKVIGSDIEMKVTSGSLQLVQADAAQIEQVFMNLCLNARDAMPEGGRLLIETEMVNLDDSFCRFYPSVTPGRYAAVSVSDTGIGMTREIRDHIFEPFFTTKERGKNTGMGLATAYGIAKQHGGFIHFHSEPGIGSLFRVYLPAMNREQAAADSSPRDAGKPLPMKLEGTETVLLAEDHDSVREMVRQWLVNLGYRILSAANGEEALKLCEQEAPAVAILDMVMPRMSGAATAAELRKRFPELPIVFTSGYSKTEDAAVAQLANSSYLQKPYSPTSLGRTIRKILDPAAVREG
jgi:two-component system cell cycle sensor histidine kinase/response regulator CckA